MKSPAGADYVAGDLAIAAGILLAVALFRSLKLDRFPLVLRRLGPAQQDETEKESV